MAKNQPKSSGLDIEDVMNDIDNQDELKKESEDLSNQLQEIHSAITQQKYLLKDMQFMTESLEQISKKLDRGAEINKEILGDIQTTISNTHNVQFTATLDDDSVSAINNAYNSFLNNQEKALNEMERDLRTHMSTFHYDLCKALNSKGFWCSQKAFKWLAGIFFASVSIIIAEITLWIAISFGK